MSHIPTKNYHIPGGEPIAETIRPNRDTKNNDKTRYDPPPPTRGYTMLNTMTSEHIFIQAWDKGYIHRKDWEILLNELSQDEASHEITNRLLYAVRRGRLKITD